MNYKSFTQIVILGSSSFVPFMQLPTNSRREVVEDLLDIKIFSSMNEIVKGRLRLVKDEIKTLELKKDNLKDKVEMQKNFIQQIEDKSQEDIAVKEKNINHLLTEENDLMNKNEEINNDVVVLQTKMTSLEGSASKLREYGNIKGKLSQKISGIVKEHKFFTENRVCPTCSQDIEETFRK